MDYLKLEQIYIMKQFTNFTNSYLKIVAKSQFTTEFAISLNIFLQVIAFHSGSEVFRKFLFTICIFKNLSKV